MTSILLIKPAKNKEYTRIKEKSTEAVASFFRSQLTHGIV